MSDQRRNQNIQEDEGLGESKTHYIKKNLSVYQKYLIMGIIGTHNIRYCELDHKGLLKQQTNKVIAPGRIIRFEDDLSYRNGTIILTDGVPDSNDYDECDGSFLFTFPL